MSDATDKSAIRRELRQKLAAMTDAQRQAKSVAATSFLTAAPEFTAARVVMLFLSMPQELDTAPLALKCWQTGKTVVVPKVSWDQRRMLPVEITSLQTNITTTGPGVREPVSGQPIPINLIDLVIVPGIGFTNDGHRIGRGMGFYDRFLALADFIGVSCGMGFEDQIVSKLPVLDHDMALSMLCTDTGIRRFATNCISP
ncbi:MAG TPA: 5-formyltetrahydrofolate cyclo-ligase [Tepidisphaeraceae bacterium]|jgi:5-formyltetrahydrofolate cyclo-ligase|nr:5-formyltetrahydrofolate cyclo-ligase [Tepidisphaeraceae bacterium]